MARIHSLFFAESGQFDSRNHEGEQVDEGPHGVVGYIPLPDHQRRHSDARPGVTRLRSKSCARSPRRNDILAEAAGITAGSWYASPAHPCGYDLIAAGMLILAGGGRGVPLDFGDLERWSLVGYRRGWPCGAVSVESVKPR